MLVQKLWYLCLGSFLLNCKACIIPSTTTEEPNDNTLIESTTSPPLPYVNIQRSTGVLESSEIQLITEDIKTTSPPYLADDANQDCSDGCQDVNIITEDFPITVGTTDTMVRSESYVNHVDHAQVDHSKPLPLRVQRVGYYPEVTRTYPWINESRAVTDNETEADNTESNNVLLRSGNLSENISESEIQELLSKMRASRAGVTFANKRTERSCTMPNGKLGQCIAVMECEEALEGLKKNVFPVICRWKKDVPIVCCTIKESAPTVPPTTTLSFGGRNQVSGCGTRMISVFNRQKRQASRMLFPAFLDKLPKTPDKNPNVVGGQEAQFGAWPWMAGIYTRNLGNENFHCGAAIVTDTYIITAAHCFGSTRGRQPARFVIRVGSLFVRNGTLHTIQSVTVHPRYNLRQNYYDIAVIRLNEPIRFTAGVRPICLPEADEQDDLVGRNVTVIGWGDLDFGGYRSNVLREVTIKVISNTDCNNAYVPVSGHTIPEGITKNFLCAGETEGGKDACQRDSGGPLMLLKNGVWILVGVVSFGFQCGEPGYPGVYTRVSEFIPWLEEVTDIADVS